MMKFVETNILVASAQEFHPRHTACLNLIAELESETCGTSPHCLAEFYSVTTRLPKELALRPGEAQLFIESFGRRFTLFALTSDEVVNEILSCGSRGITGGRLYDSLILASARKAHATEIYTLNRKHFCQIAPDLTSIIREP